MAKAKPNLIAKFQELLGSRRFWLVGVSAVVWGLLQGGVIEPALAEPIIAWGLATAGVGTVDKFRSK